MKDRFAAKRSGVTHTHFWWNGFAWDEYEHSHEMLLHEQDAWSLKDHIEHDFLVVLEGNGQR